MAGERANAESEPELVDDEEGGESTVAMASPTFDPSASGMPLPISNPPPPLPITPPDGVPAAPLAASPAPPRAPLAMPPTAPVPFLPGAEASRRAPPSGPAVPQLGSAKPPSGPIVPTPLGGLTPSGQPRTTGAAPVSSRRRPQTVIGLAPPPPGAPRPAAPAAPSRPPLPSAVAGAPRPSAPPAAPAQSAVPAFPPLAPSPRPPASAAKAPPFDNDAAGAKDDGPTMMGSTEQSLALFGLDAGAADAARAAVASPGPRPAPLPGRSPLASTAFSGGSGGPPPLPPSSRGGAGPAFARDERPPGSNPLPQPIERMEEEESTRAVPREELLRGQDAHVVVGDDAVGEDATLAVSPGDNEANSKHLAALAQTMAQDPDGAFPPPPGVFPPPHAGAGYSPAPNMMGPPPGVMNGPGQGWGEPQQQPWSPGGPQSAPMPSMHGAPHDRPTSNPHMPVSSPHPMSYPGPAQMGMGPGPGYPPMGMPMQGPAPGPYPGQLGPAMQGQAPWPAPSGKRFKLSGQIILLGIVGVICLAIFITGLVLFATTKF